MINVFFLLQLFGVDWDGFLFLEENVIEVFDIRFFVSNSDYVFLIREVSLLNDIIIYGIDFYERIV